MHEIYGVRRLIPVAFSMCNKILVVLKMWKVTKHANMALRIKNLNHLPQNKIIGDTK